MNTAVNPLAQGYADRLVFEGCCTKITLRETGETRHPDIFMEYL